MEAVKVKTIIMIEGQVFTSESDGANPIECAENARMGVIAQMIKKKYQELRQTCKNDYEATLATAADLNIGERTVYRYVKGY